MIDDTKGNSFVLNLATRLGCQHAPKSVNHVAIIAVDYVAIGGLHFQTIARGPGAAAQHTPIATGCAAPSFVSIETPFPNVSADIVQAQGIRLETCRYQRRPLRREKPFARA